MTKTLKNKLLFLKNQNSELQALVPTLKRKNFLLIQSQDAYEALEIIKKESDLKMILLDWSIHAALPIKDLCQHLSRNQRYVIALDYGGNDVEEVNALKSGASVYLRNPLHKEILLAQLQAGMRNLRWQKYFKSKIEKLQCDLGAMAEFEESLPICTKCHKIKEETAYAMTVERDSSSHIAEGCLTDVCQCAT